MQYELTGHVAHEPELKYDPAEHVAPPVLPPPDEVHALELVEDAGDVRPDGHAVAAAVPPVQYEFAGHETHEPELRYFPAEHVVSAVVHADEAVEPAGEV